MSEILALSMPSRRALERLRPNAADDDIGAAYAAACWSHLTEPGDAVAGRAVARSGAVRALEMLLAGGGDDDPDLAEGRRRWRPRWRPDDIDIALQRAVATGVRLVLPGDEDWPGALDDLGDHAPLSLWVRGDPRVLSRTSLAVVGARAATSYGERVATELTSDLAADGLVIVSGAAYGIDGAAHRAALGAGAATVAFMAGGVDRSYPTGHSRLLDDIAASGAVVSEVPCAAAPTKWRFLQRNRLIAALSRATVVVEAGWRSGSLNTAAHAAALGRELGAVPGPITSAASAGTHRLLREYDAVCITGAADVREMLGVSAPALLPRLDAVARTDDTSRVVDALSARTWRSPDEIARRSGVDPPRVAALLGLLLLDGRAERGIDGWRVATAG